MRPQETLRIGLFICKEIRKVFSSLNSHSSGYEAFDPSEDLVVMFLIQVI